VKNKKGVLGLGILLVFGVLAFVPFLFTPYDPTRTVNLAGSMAAPSWLKGFPGYTGLSENVIVISKPGFDSSSSMNEYNFVSSLPALTNIRYSSSLGYSQVYGKGAGCVAISYSTNRAQSGNTTVYMEKTFKYPYNGPPERFTGDVAVFVSGTSKAFANGQTILSAPVIVNIFIRNETGKQFTLWSTDYVDASTFDWISTRIQSQVSLLDSRSDALKTFMYGYIIKPNGDKAPYWHFFPVQPETDVFGFKAQNLTFGIEVIFVGDPSVAEAETTVFIDGLYFQTLGTAWGILGTDNLGRDIFTQLIYGVRVSLYVGFLASLIGVVLGLIVGLVAGYLGRAVDELLMRFSDALLVIPSLPLLIVLIAVLGASVNNLIILLGLLGWMGFARTVRSQVLSLRERPFIEAAKAAGAGKVHIMTKHILPNVMSLVYVTLATSVPGAVVAEASLSWLGFFDPNVMSWGRMLNAVQFEASGAFDKWWWAVPPGLCIALLATAFILIGYSMDEVLNPRLRARA
jgi:ABC-type dipeptide/oligopeptide/nickel transport system permease subunit